MKKNSLVLWSRRADRRSKTEVYRNGTSVVPVACRPQPLAMPRLYLLTACVAVALSLSAALGDELSLDSGIVYEGKLIQQTNKEVRFQISGPTGTSIITLPLAMVQSITVDGKGEVYHGTMLTSAPAPASASPVSDPTVEGAIAQANSSQPDWWDSVQLTFPSTLDLTWKHSDEFDATVNLADYLWKEILPHQDRWKEGVKLISQTVGASKASPANRKLSMTMTATAYDVLLEDYARAAWWYRNAGDTTTDDRLARCYLKLGSKPMAADLLGKYTADPTPRGGMIRLWATMGEQAKAMELAEQTASAGRPEIAYLAAGDVLRQAGDIKKAILYYQKVLAVDSPKDAKAKPIAACAIDAIKAMEALDLTRIKDGRYSGTVPIGYRSPITIEVTIKGGKIESCKVTNCKDDMPWTSLLEIPRQIVQRQTIKGVDGVTGATDTSTAIVDATADALSQAPRVSSTSGPATRYKDGAYSGKARGFRSDVTVDLKIKDGKIASITVTDNDTPRFMDRAKAGTLGKISQNNGTAGLDTVSGATFSSRAIINATIDALKQASK